MKAGATTPKTTPTSGQATELDLKKAISLQLQNALKLVMSQNPTTSAASGRTTVTQDSKALVTSLRPQSAPATPVKASTSSTITPSPSKAVSSSTLSPLKAGTVTCKLTTAKVVASSSPRKNIGVGTNPPTSVGAVTSQAAKAKGSSPSVDGVAKKGKLSAIESLLCEETISPKNSPGSAPSQVKEEVVPRTPPKRASPVPVKKAEVSKTETEKREPTEEADSPKVKPAADSQNTKPPKADDLQKVKPPADSQKVNPQNIAAESQSEIKPTDNVETKPTDNVEAKPVDSVEAKPIDAKLTDKVQTKPTDDNKAKPTDKVQTKPTDDNKAKPTDKVQTKPTDDNEAKPTDKVEAKPTDKVQIKPTDDIEAKPTADESSNQNSTKDEEMSTEASEKKPLTSSDIESEVKAKPQATVTSDSTMDMASPPVEQTTLKESTLKQNMDEIAPVTNNEMAKTESTNISPANIELSKPTNIELSKPTPSPSATHTATEKEGVILNKATRKRSPPPSLSESDQPPPAKKQAIAPQEDVAVDLPTTSPSNTATATVLLTTTTSTTTHASITSTPTVTVTVLASQSPMEVVTHDATPDFNITTPSQLPTEVNTDSLIQSLCSDSTSFEDPDVSVLASQLGLDSVDSPVFNLSGFLSLIQPDLSVLTPEEQSSAIGGQLLGDASTSADQQPSEETVGESTPRNSEIQNQTKVELSLTPLQSEPTTTTSFPATQTLPVAVTSLQPEVSIPIPSAPVLIPTTTSRQPLMTSSPSAPPPSACLHPIPESITTTSTSVPSPLMFPEEPIPPRPLMLGLSTDIPNLNQAPPPSLGAPLTPTPLTPTPLTPLGEGLLDLSDIRSLVDESEVMEGISQDVFESIEKLVNLDEQSTNATWK